MKKLIRPGLFRSGRLSILQDRTAAKDCRGTLSASHGKRTASPTMMDSICGIGVDRRLPSGVIADRDEKIRLVFRDNVSGVNIDLRRSRSASFRKRNEAGRARACGAKLF